jgi:hypothetical protein
LPKRFAVGLRLGGVIVAVQLEPGNGIRKIDLFFHDDRAVNAPQHEIEMAGCEGLSRRNMAQTDHFVSAPRAGRRPTGLLLQCQGNQPVSREGVGHRLPGIILGDMQG